MVAIVKTDLVSKPSHEGQASESGPGVAVRLDRRPGVLRLPGQRRRRRSIALAAFLRAASRRQPTAVASVQLRRRK